MMDYTYLFHLIAFAPVILELIIAINMARDSDSFSSFLGNVFVYFGIIFILTSPLIAMWGPMVYQVMKVKGLIP